MCRAKDIMIDKAIKTSEIVTMEFSTSYENAFLYIANPKNLPLWTLYLVEADEVSTTIQTPSGKVAHGLVTEASFETGVIDWHVISPDGKKVEKFCSRLIGLPNGNCVYSFMFFAYPDANENPIETLANKREQIVTELGKLKDIFADQNDN